MMSVNTEVIYSSIPNIRKRHNFCVFLFCLLFYSGGIFFATRIGYFVVKTIDKIMNEFIFIILNTFNLVAVVCFYGLRKFRDDVHFMIGIRFSAYSNALYILNPLLLGSLLIYNVYNFYTHKVEVKFPWMRSLEIFFLWFILVAVVFYFFVYLVLVVLGKNLPVFKPAADWGPRYSTLVKSRRMFKAYNMAKEYLYRQERFRHLRETNV